MLNDLFEFIGNDIYQKKFSSFLTLLAISFGILTIFLIIVISQGFEESVTEEFNQLGTNRLFITSPTFNGGDLSSDNTLQRNELALIERKPYIKEAFPFYTSTLPVKFGNEFQNVILTGSILSQEFYSSFNIDVEEGRLPKENERFNIAIGPYLANEIFDKEIHVGSSIIIANKKFKVVGIYESLGNPQDDSSLFMNIETLQEINNDLDIYTFIYATTTPGYNVSLAAENLKNSLENVLGDDTIDVVSADQFLDQFNTILSLIRYTLGGIAVVSLIVGAFGIINTMYVIVTEKIKTIGIMKAIGASNETILFLFILYAGLFGLLGALLGIIIGIGLGYAFEYFAQLAGYTFLHISIDPLLIISLILFGFLIGVLAGYLPSKKASQLIIVDAIRK